MLPDLQQEGNRISFYFFPALIKFTLIWKKTLKLILLNINFQLIIKYNLKPLHFLMGFVGILKFAAGCGNLAAF